MTYQSAEAQDSPDVIETDSPFSSKMDFSFILMRQVERINIFLSRLNETPPYVWNAYGKPDTNFNPENVKPNRDNFVFSVISLQIMLVPYHTPAYRDFEKKLKGDEDLKKDPVMLARKRYLRLMMLMSEKNLLPVQIIE